LKVRNVYLEDIACILSQEDSHNTCDQNNVYSHKKLHNSMPMPKIRKNGVNSANYFQLLTERFIQWGVLKSSIKRTYSMVLTNSKRWSVSRILIIKLFDKLCTYRQKPQVVWLNPSAKPYTSRQIVWLAQTCLITQLIKQA